MPSPNEIASALRAIARRPERVNIDERFDPEAYHTVKTVLAAKAADVQLGGDALTALQARCTIESLLRALDAARLECLHDVADDLAGPIDEAAQ